MPVCGIRDRGIDVSQVQVAQLKGDVPIDSIAERGVPGKHSGVLFSKTELKYSGSVQGATFANRVTGSSEGAFFGVGTTFDLGSGWALQADFTHVMDAAAPQFGQSDSHNLSVGFRWSF